MELSEGVSEARIDAKRGVLLKCGGDILSTYHSPKQAPVLTLKLPQSPQTPLSWYVLPNKLFWTWPSADAFRKKKLMRGVLEYNCRKALKFLLLFRRNICGLNYFLRFWFTAVQTTVEIMLSVFIPTLLLYSWGFNWQANVLSKCFLWLKIFLALRDYRAQN